MTLPSRDLHRDYFTILIFGQRSRDALCVTGIHDRQSERVRAVISRKTVTKKSVSAGEYRSVDRDIFDPQIGRRINQSPEVVVIQDGGGATIVKSHRRIGKEDFLFIRQ